ncbi:uncharacterized protein LOC108087085 [Drosophila ficusphila]|uniref:uncharacterized protein LOC108087085 n=1 Tax=Drosophila ficusphila TaxID=30025 RepID=UPI0007E61D4C|nr:uncharacterized protein LOC108087085 [Drosophila ficusphila]
MPSATKEEESRKFMVGSSDSEAENEDLAFLNLVLRKLNIKDQALLHRLVDKVPDAFNSLWRDQHQCLDLGRLRWKLHGSNLDLFLQNMCTEFRSVHFRSEQMQEELNILEQADIERLINVKSCEISWGQTNNKKNRNIPQWPFHALPKLLCNLTNLIIHAPVQACFIERFKKLESLKIYEEISSTALDAIVSTDAPLRQLHLYGNHSRQLLGISKCKNLSNLLIDLHTFLSSMNEILQLPDLLVLRLNQLKKCGQLKTLQLNCSFMNHSKWLTKLELNRCHSLDELELVDCKFENQNISKMCLPVSQSYAMFCNCPDLIDDQLLDFIKASPNLKELVLIKCPEVTEELLNGVVKVRRTSGEKQDPLLFRVKDCQNISDSYHKNLASWARKRSLLKMEFIMEDYIPIDHVQFIFHEPQRDLNIYNNES